MTIMRHCRIARTADGGPPPQAAKHATNGTRRKGAIARFPPSTYTV